MIAALGSETRIVAVNKTTREARSKRDPDTWDIKPVAAQVRGSARWKAWVEGLAKAHRQSVAGVIDTALARLAREIGYREPPPR